MTAEDILVRVVCQLHIASPCANKCLSETNVM